jgi:hypothetical protein
MPVLKLTELKIIPSLALSIPVSSPKLPSIATSELETTTPYQSHLEPVIQDKNNYI